MKDAKKTKQQLLEELFELRRRTAQLREAEAKRIRAEVALRESEERYRAVTDHAAVGIGYGRRR